MNEFARFFTWLDGQLLAFIGSKTAALAAGIEPFAMTCGLIYVMFWAWLALTNRIQELVMDGILRIVTFAVVIGFSIRLWLYNSVVVDTFTNGPGQIAQILVGASSPVSLIDDILLQGGMVGKLFWDRAGITDMGGYFAAGGAFGVLGVLCAISAGLLILAKIATACILALGPLFMLALLFKTTQRFFENWVSYLVNFSLITVLVSAVGSLLLYVASKFAASAASSGAAVTVTELFVMGVFAGAIIYVLCQIRSIAAGLSGGIAMGSYALVGRALSWGKSTAQQAGRGAVEGAVGIPRTKYDSVPRLVGSMAVQTARGLLPMAGERQGGTISRDRAMPPPSVR